MAFKRVQLEKGIRQVGPDRWEVQVHVGRDPSSGKLRQVSRTTRKGIADARRLRARLITEISKGEHGGTTGTLGSLLDAWLAHAEDLGRSPTTIAGYRKKIEATIRPELGDRVLDKLTAHDLDSFYGALLGRGASAATVMHYHRIISAALATAERWGWVQRNVAKLARPPAVLQKELTIPPPERVQALIQAAAESKSPEWATVITMAALTGLRRGELCGLKWFDIDWKGSAITVRRSIWQTSDGWGEKDPKSHQIRRLLLGEHAMAVLAGRWKRVSEAAELSDVPLPESGFIFATDIAGTTPMLPGAVTLAFTRLCRRMEAPALKAAKLEKRDLRTDERWPYRFHDLRHYSASELFRAGHNPRTVADRLGHADPAVTLKIYTHDTEDQARAAADSLESGLMTLPAS
jgi:integrase